jgi:hypothetical protein
VEVKGIMYLFFGVQFENFLDDATSVGLLSHELHRVLDRHNQELHPSLIDGLQTLQKHIVPVHVVNQRPYLGLDLSQEHVLQVLLVTSPSLK